MSIKEALNSVGNCEIGYAPIGKEIIFYSDKKVILVGTWLHKFLLNIGADDHRETSELYDIGNYQVTKTIKGEDNLLQKWQSSRGQVLDSFYFNFETASVWKD